MQRTSRFKMIFSTAIFLSGTNFYKKSSPRGNVFTEVFKMMIYALKSKRKRKDNEHWMDLAKDKYPEKDVENAKILFQILWLYLPLPLYWTLYDEEGTRWTFQATRMDGRVGSFTVQPDQIVFLPEIMVVILIPIFNKWIYPALGKCGLLRKPLQRMITGGTVLAISFIFAGVLEIEIQKSFEVEPACSYFEVINMVNTDYIGQITKIGDSQPRAKFEIPRKDNYLLKTAVLAGEYELGLEGIDQKTTFILLSQKIVCVVIYLDAAGQVQFLAPKDSSRGTFMHNIGKSSEGLALLRVIQNGLLKNCTGMNESECDVLEHVHVRKHDCNYQCDTGFGSKQAENGQCDHHYSCQKAMQPGSYTLLFAGTPLSQFDLEYAGSYIYIIIDDGKNELRTQLNKLERPRAVHIAWLVPQLTLLALSSILLPVTILDFSYKEAPQSMKSILQGCWLLTVAVGNLISAVIASVGIYKDQWKEFFLMSGVMLVDMMIFAYMAKIYKPADLDYDEDDTVDTAIEVMGTV